MDSWTVASAIHTCFYFSLIMVMISAIIQIASGLKLQKFTRSSEFIKVSTVTCHKNLSHALCIFTVVAVATVEALSLA